jgi:hypothetical protein
MKQKIFAASAGLLFLIALFFILKASLNKNSAEVSVCIDTTDSLKPEPVATEIYTSQHLGNNKWASIRITINTFSNFDYNTSYFLKLPAKLSLLSNPDQRDRSIEEYKQGFENQLNKIRQQALELPKSSIYGPMIRDLNRLARSTAEKKTALYFTDCRENTALFSIYKKSDSILLKKHPEKVRALFAQIEKPNSLKGIRVFLVCKPTTDEENYSFGLMSNFFKKILEDAGAKVYIGADLNVGDDL